MHMLYWGQVVGVLGFLSKHPAVPNNTEIPAVVAAFQLLLGFADEHAEGLDDPPPCRTRECLHEVQGQQHREPLAT